MFPDLKKYLVGKEVNIKNTVIEHLEKLTKKIEQYYGDTVKPTNDHDWTIIAADVPELPLRVSKEFTDMIAEPLNRIIFNSFKSNIQKCQQIFSFGLQCDQLIQSYQRLQSNS